jgi:hypothetical protein
VPREIAPAVENVPRPRPVPQEDHAVRERKGVEDELRWTRGPSNVVIRVPDGGRCQDPRPYIMRMPLAAYCHFLGVATCSTSRDAAVAHSIWVGQNKQHKRTGRRTSPLEPLIQFAHMQLNHQNKPPTCTKGCRTSPLRPLIQCQARPTKKQLMAGSQRPHLEERLGKLADGRALALPRSPPEPSEDVCLRHARLARQLHSATMLSQSTDGTSGHWT